MNSTIFLSAQPDNIYFIWQLELQLRNLKSLAIDKEAIHVVVGYNPQRGINPAFNKFINDHLDFAQFFLYPDNRIEPCYTSSIRPHILKQHFSSFSELQFKTIFYHDSDVLFSRIPQTPKSDINECFVSDTRGYLDLNYIRRVANEALLDDMLSIVGLDKSIIEGEDANTGGAQYILNGIDANFWDKVETDAESLYLCMREYNDKLWQNNYEQTREYRSKKRGIQAWCADMWAVLWNLWLVGKKVSIHQELDFSWPYSPIEQWTTKAILHYSGDVKRKEDFFKKNEYLNRVPWYDCSLLSIPQQNCSSKIVEFILQRKRELDSQRNSYLKSCLILEIDTIDNNIISDLDLFHTVISKYLNISFFVLAKFGILEPNEIHQPILTYSDLLPENYQQVIFIPIASIPAIKDLKEMLRIGEKDNLNNTYLKVLPNKNLHVDALFKEVFTKVLDFEVLSANQGKFNQSLPRKAHEIRILNLKHGYSASKSIGDLLHDPTISRKHFGYVLDSTYNFS